MTSGPFLKFCHNWFSKPYSQHDLQAMYCLNRTPVLPHVIGNSPCRGCHGFWQLDVFRMEPIFKLFAAGFVGNCFNSSGCHCKKVKWWRPKRKNSVTWLSGRLNVVLLLFWSPVFPTSVSNDSKRIKMRQHLLQSNWSISIPFWSCGTIPVIWLAGVHHNPNRPCVLLSCKAY